MTRQNFYSNTKWEPLVGYSRAVKVDSTIYVSGTTATNENSEIVGINDPYRQTIQIFNNIEQVLKQAGATLKHVVRTRMFVTDISHWQVIGLAHAEIFNSPEMRPASTMVEVQRLINPDMLIEIEVDAVIP